MINIWTQSQSIALHRNIVHEIQELSLLPCTLPLVCACPCRKNRNREFMRCVKHVYLNRKNCFFLLGFVPTKWFDVYWIDEKIILISSNTHAQKAIENLWIADFGLEINKFKVFHVINAYAILRQTCLATLSCLFFRLLNVLFLHHDNISSSSNDKWASLLNVRFDRAHHTKVTQFYRINWYFFFFRQRI